MPKHTKLSLFKSSAIFLCLFLYILLYLPTPAKGAAKTWDGGGGDNLASTAENWDDDLAPVAGDTLIFNSLSVKDCTFDVADPGSLDIQTGYTGVVTLANSIDIDGGGSIAVEDGTFDANDFNITTTNVTSTGSTTTVISMGTGTWTTAGNVLLTNSSLTLNEETSNLLMTTTGTLSLGTGLELYNLSLGSNITITLGTDVTLKGLFDMVSVTGSNVLNGNALYIEGDFRTTGFSSDLSGSTVIHFSGGNNQTWGINTSFMFVSNPIVINKSANTLSLGENMYIGGNLTHTAGTFDANGKTVFLNASGATWDTDGMTFYNFDTNATGYTLTLSSDMTVANNFESAGSSHAITINGSGNRFILQGDLAARGIISGDATFEFGGGNAQGYSQTNALNNPIVINKSAGTLTFNNNQTFGGDFTYTAGTVDFGTTTTTRAGTVNHNSGSLNFYNLILDSGASVTLTGNLTATTLTNNAGAGFIPGSYTFSVSSLFAAGSTAFTQGTSTFVASGTTTLTTSAILTFYKVTITTGQQLTIPTLIGLEVSNLFTSVGATILSANPGTMALWTVTGSQNVSTTTATDIDSSQGNEIHNRGGTNTNTSNWDNDISKGRGNFFQFF